MPDFTNLPFADLLTTLHDLTPKGYRVYLVGGSVRDLLLNERIHDLDFTVDGDPFVIGRRLADILGAAFYIMDEVHPTCRVLHHLPADDAILTIDFAALRANHIESDLRARDFTFNAIAIALDRPHRLIDPLGGAQHIKDRTLKACSPTAFSDDPIRVLRAIRQALQFNCRIQPQSLQWIRQAALQLERISSERQRDELFKMLAGVNPAAAIHLLDQIGAAQIVIPELMGLKNLTQPPPHTLDAWEHSLAILRWLEALFAVLVGDFQSSTAANLHLGLAVLRLGRYREQLDQHFSTSISDTRSRRSLLIFAALCHDVGKQHLTPLDYVEIETAIQKHAAIGADIAAQRAKTLALSSAEIQYINRLIHNHMEIHRMLENSHLPECLTTYRYFRDMGSEGIDLCLLSLADTMAKYMPALQQDHWTQELDICRHLMESWWEKKAESVDPPRLLSGHDLLSHFNLAPGPSIGLLLEAIRESQVCGKLSNKGTALEFAAQWLQNQG